MEYLEIEGGRALAGEVCIQGSKNAVLPILSAALLNQGVTVLKNCPKIIDVAYMLEILRELGCKVRWEGELLLVDASSVRETCAPREYAEKMRSSIILLGSLLGRMGEAFLPYPGGCVIGERPIDFHIEALRKMGAEFCEDEEGLRALCDRPRGARIQLSFPSVGATENVILLAVLAEGTTVLKNAAREPEIWELCRFLNSLGAKIQGAGTSRIVITGVKSLHDGEFTIMPDRIVAGTYMLLAAAAGGKVILRNPPLEQLGSLRKVLAAMGAGWERQGEGLLIWGLGRPKSVTEVCTEPYPGFPTDLQSPLMAALCLARGESRIRENLFEARFKIVEELRKMGAQIETSEREAAIRGVERLHGADLYARELRGGAALVLAAAAAEGRSRVFGCSYINRGYENIIRDLQGLGVMVKCRSGHFTCA